MNNSLICKNIRYQRISAKMTKKQLAEKLNVNSQTITKWERGICTPDTESLELLASLFRIRTEELSERDFYDESILPLQSLPIIVNEHETDTDDNTLHNVRFRDIFSTKKIQESAKKTFDSDYEWTVKKSLMFNGTFKRHPKGNVKQVLSQGMFQNYPENKLGVQSPYIYARVFIVLLLFIGLSLLSKMYIPSIFLASLIVPLTLLVYVFEMNYPRNINILQLLICCSCGLLAIFISVYAYKIIDTYETIEICISGLVEETAKLAVLCFVVYFFKPKYILSGMLLGFAVGAAFSVFETCDYILVFDTLNQGTLILGKTALSRSINSLLSGHHYWTGIIGGGLALSMGRNKFSFKQIFNKNVFLLWLIAVSLHTCWNISTFLSSTTLIYTIWILISLVTVWMFFSELRTGLAQYKISNDLNVSSQIADSEIPAAEPTDCKSPDCCKNQDSGGQ